MQNRCENLLLAEMSRYVLPGRRSIVPQNRVTVRVLREETAPCAAWTRPTAQMSPRIR
jgi:hypothetical protein